MSDPLRIRPAGVGLDTSERERKRALAALAIFGTLSVVLPALSLAVGPASVCFLTCLPGLGVIASIGFLAIAVAPGRAALFRGTAEIDGDHLLVRSDNGRVDRRVPIAGLVQGHHEHPDLVHLLTTDGETLLVRPHEDAVAMCDRLLQACGVGVADRVLRVPLPSAAARLPGGRLFAGVVLALDFAAAAIGMVIIGIVLNDSGPETLIQKLGVLATMMLVTLGPLALLGYGVLRTLRRREAVVGADGVVLRGALRTRRMAYAEVERVTPDLRGVRLHRADGTSLLLPTSGAEALPLPPRVADSGALPDAEARRDVLLRRIHDALEARARRAFERPGLDALDRRGRSIEAWRADLARVGEGDADYRRAGLTRADLAGVIEDVAAPAERRIAAAVVLAAGEPEEARRRVRVAVEASADDDLRRALESAGEGTIDEGLVERMAKRA